MLAGVRDLFGCAYHVPDFLFCLGCHAYHLCYTFAMPNYKSHPLRVIRRRHGLEMKELARLCGVSRATISQIEEGRTKKPNAKVIEFLAKIEGVSVVSLSEAVDVWRDSALLDLLPKRAASVLLILPEDLPKLYPSFQAWRSEFSDNPTHFASLLRINRMTVAKYERGGFVGGLPDSLARALSARLGLSGEYLSSLEELHIG
jgi:transcriptional regulator with XRE-family HTH domain